MQENERGEAKVRKLEDTLRTLKEAVEDQARQGGARRSASRWGAHVGGQQRAKSACLCSLACCQGSAHAWPTMAVTVVDRPLAMRRQRWRRCALPRPRARPTPRSGC